MLGRDVLPAGRVIEYSSVAGANPSIEAPPTLISLSVASEDTATENLISYTVVAPVCAFTVILVVPFTPPSSIRTVCVSSPFTYEIVGNEVVPRFRAHVYAVISELNAGDSS